jgi:NTP pyrophosphatase (non-canonical NTP hydrolase)
MVDVRETRGCMLKLKEGWVEYGGIDGTFLTPTGCNHREALVFIWHPGREPINGRVHAFPSGEWSYEGFETEREAHEYLLRMGGRSPWEVVGDTATVNDLDGFQCLAMRTAGDSSDDGWILEKALGLSEETGEVLGLLKKSGWHGRELDRDALRKELGDVLWYVAALAHGHGFSLSEIATANIEKLRKRYPDGFSVERSLNRGGE